jgi:hypothetical protein
MDMVNEIENQTEDDSIDLNKYLFFPDVVDQGSSAVANYVDSLGESEDFEEQAKIAYEKDKKSFVDQENSKMTSKKVM